MPSGKENQRVEQDSDNQGQWQRLIPMVADGGTQAQRMFQQKVGEADEGKVQADDDQCACREVDHYPRGMVVEQLATVKHAEEETDVDRIEQRNVQKE